MSESGLGCYVYCVVRGDQHLPLDGLPGVDQELAPGLLIHRELAALVSGVRLEEFGAEALKRNLEDLAWLERTARAHDAVLGRALAGDAIVPMRLCTIFADEAGVRQMLDRERETLLEVLERLHGHEEWSVKLLADTQSLNAAARERDHALAGVAAGSATPTPGREYFARKKQEQGVRERAQAIADEAAQQTHDSLCAHAAAGILLPPQDPGLSRRAGQMVLNGAYLVERSHAATFGRCAGELGSRLRAHGLELELSGPFAPYNFVREQRP